MSKTNKRRQVKDPRGGKSLGHHWRDLTPSDRAFLLAVIRTYGKQDYDVHMGVLPFVPVAVAVEVLRRVLMDNVNRRTVAKLLKKLRVTTVDTSAHLTMRMTLRHARVVKRFGDWIKRGGRIPFAQAFQTTAGLKWSLPQRGYVYDDEAKVFPMFTLRLINRVDRNWSSYDVTCPKTYSNEMRNWLLKVCR